MDPQSWNRYTYARNEPVNLTDPLGLEIGVVVNLGPNCVAVRQVFEYYSYWVLFGSGCYDGGGNSNDRGTPRRGGEARPCRNVNGFVSGIPENGSDRVYSPGELNDAVITVFGEMNAHFNSNSRAEAEAIASVILNRSTAIANGTAPPKNLWGASSSLTDVVKADNQFAGLRAGKNALREGVDLDEGGRNCSRLQTAGGAIAWLAANPGARGPYLYMCNKNSVTKHHPDDVEINNNTFSSKDLGCR